MVCCLNATLLEFWAFDLLVVINGRVDWAGFPMITHPSGVLTASWLLSSLHVSCVCVWASIQSRPISRIVGHFCFIGKLGASCDRPGMDETSSGVGMSCKALGNF